MVKTKKTHNKCGFFKFHFDFDVFYGIFCLFVFFEGKPAIILDRIFSPYKFSYYPLITCGTVVLSMAFSKWLQKWLRLSMDWKSE